MNKQEKIAVGVALVAAIILFFGGQLWSMVTGSMSVAPASTAASANAGQPGQGDQIVLKNISTVKGLEIYDEQVGTGAVAKAGQSVSAHYIGYFTDGKKFDSSVDRGIPFTFLLGNGDVIKGWDQGIAGMKVGGIRRLVVSPDFAYGKEGRGTIPPNATLIFEVQLLGVK